MYVNYINYFVFCIFMLVGVYVIRGMDIKLCLLTTSKGNCCWRKYFFKTFKRTDFEGKLEAMFVQVNFRKKNDCQVAPITHKNMRLENICEQLERI